MTDDQLHGLAELTILNAQVLQKMLLEFTLITEKLLPLVPEKAVVLGCLSDLEQLQATATLLAPALERTKREFGIV